MWNFYTILLQIHSGNCLQKIDILDLSFVKLLQNEQGCNFFLPHSVDSQLLGSTVRSAILATAWLLVLKTPRLTKIQRTVSLCSFSPNL